MEYDREFGTECGLEYRMEEKGMEEQTDMRIIGVMPPEPSARKLN